jgi:hypothetical protein
MAHFHIQQKRNKKGHKITQGHSNKTAFRMQYTILSIVKQHPQTDKYNRSGIYQMKCLPCPLGQTGRSFHTSYEEHIPAIRNSHGNSGYSNHILNT